MDKTLTVVWSNKEIEFSDLDKDNEMEITVTDQYDDNINVYMTKENLVSLKSHIEYLLKKMK